MNTECPACEAIYDTVEGALACLCYVPPVRDEVPAQSAQSIPAPKAAELLGRAAKHMHDRSSTYDKPEGERSMGRAVQAFNAITGHTLSESEGWLLLQVLKDVRLFTRSDYHADSAEDCIAYAALKAEARGEGR